MAVVIDVQNAAQALLLIATANSVPWALGRAFGERWALPLDLGLRLSDGQRLFGAHKTWRGFAGGVLACAIVGELLVASWPVGSGVGALSLLADAVSSAVKRRLKRPPGTEVPGLDQFPESALPLAVFASPLGLGLWDIVAVSGLFLILDIGSLGCAIRPVEVSHRRMLPVGYY